VVDVGIDGGGLDDLLGLTVSGATRRRGEWLSWSHAWAHPSVLERRKSEAQRFKDFEADGDLTIVEKIGEDVDEVAAIVARVETPGCWTRSASTRPASAACSTRWSTPASPQEKVVGISQGWKLTGAIKTPSASSPRARWCTRRSR
jgi:phage terminase large subunit-like protein